ncbi:MAG: hypothetical protein JXB10_00765 [Pirellulales bacterium]|nr:hypothetical protein [Pirellulales bacterium]
MDPQSLIAPGGSPVPAPMWFVEFFKVLGFTLHAIPMNLWYAGLPVALGLLLFGGEHGRHFGVRLLRQMPVIVAVGVNLGIVPLLFMQLAYYRFFYPATILMAWYWLGIIALLIPAYYGVYLYAWGLKDGGNGVSPGRKLAGWLSALLFIAVGFFFANGLSLMDHVERWPELFRAQQTAGAVPGIALNVGDPTLWPRWLLMFGLALTTTAAWVLVDTAFFHRQASEEYRSWAWGFTKILYTVGMLWTAAAGTWYVFGTWAPELRREMFSGGLIVLTLLTAASTGLPWLMIVTEKRRPPQRLLVTGIALAQFGVLALNAVSRQILQNLNINRYYNILRQETELQTGPLLMFLLTFVFALCILAWMLRQAVKAHRNPAPKNA